jgi:predicted nucleotidyltransferase
VDTIEFAKDKRDEILALATRHKATEIRVVVPENEPADKSSSAKAVGGESDIKIVATFLGDPQTTQYFDALMAFQTDLEVWLGVNVHVYDARGFKGADGEDFLRKTRLLGDV